MAKRGVVQKIEVTVLKSFIDRKRGIRYSIGDVELIRQDDYDRIQQQGNFFKQGNHRFGNGTCKPCSSRSKK